MHVERHSIAVTTIADGSATVYSPVITGKIANIIYVKTDFADGVDFTITLEATGQTLWADTNINASEVVAPRQATHDTAGAASLYAAGGEPVEDDIVCENDRVKIVIAQGGDKKTGTFIIIVA
jgi:hypothetical protein